MLRTKQQSINQIENEKRCLSLVPECLQQFQQSMIISKLHSFKGGFAKLLVNRGGANQAPWLANTQPSIWQTSNDQKRQFSDSQNNGSGNDGYSHKNQASSLGNNSIGGQSEKGGQGKMFNRRRSGSSSSPNSYQAGYGGRSSYNQGGSSQRYEGGRGGHQQKVQSNSYQNQAMQQQPGSSEQAMAFHKQKENKIDQVFMSRYGKTKSELLDSWLEMDASLLTEECQRMGLAPSSKHIENIQNLFETLKKIEAEIEASNAAQQQASGGGQLGGQDSVGGSSQTVISKGKYQVSGAGYGGQQQRNTQTGGDHNLFKSRLRVTEKPNLYQQQQTTSTQPQGSAVTGQGGHLIFQRSDLRAFMQDQEKARENLNEQLARILNKRKTKLPQEASSSQGDLSSSSNTAPGFNTGATNTSQRGQGGLKLFSQSSQPSSGQFNTQSQAAEVSYQREQSQWIQNPFQFSMGTIKKQLQDRSQAPTSSASPDQSQQSNAAHATHFHYTHTDSAIIDKIFEMSPEQLDAQFHSYASTQSSVFAQMALKQEEFEKLPSITKKKVLINMTGVRQTLASNPNVSLSQEHQQHQSSRNLKSLVTFAKENWLFLNQASKSLLGGQLSQMLKNQSEVKNLLIGNPAFQVDFSRIVKELVKDEKELEAVKLAMSGIFHEENEHFFNDITLEQAVQYGKVIQFITEGSSPQSATKLQNSFYNRLKKCISKKNVKNLPFNDQLALLEALPPVDMDAFSSQKSLHYILLNEIMSQGPMQAQHWESLSKGQIMQIVERCNEMSKCRDLNNKLRGCLLDIKTQEFSLADFHKMFKVLAENGFMEGKGALDVKLVSSLLMRRNIKTAANLVNSADAKELKEFVDFYEFLYRLNPVVFAFVPQEVKLLLTRATQLAAEQRLPLNEMTRFSNVFIPSLYKPQMFFSDMITHKGESFKRDVGKENLYSFVSEIIQRAKDCEYGFEHLQMSNSRMHRNYKAFTEKTILLLQRILADLVEPNQGGATQTIAQEDLKIITKILSSQQLSELLFKTSEDVSQTLTPIVESMLSHFDDRTAALVNKTSVSGENFLIDFTQWGEHFEAMSTIALLSGALSKDVISTNGLKNKLVNQLAPASFNLLKQELYKTNSFSQSHQTNVSPLDNLFKLNKSILSFFDQAGYIEASYQDSQVRELVTVVLESFFLNKKPFILSFEKFKKNIKISKMIQIDTNKELMRDNFREIVHFMTYAQNLEGAKDIAKQVCGILEPHSRSIVGRDLVNLFKMIDRFALTDDVMPLLINVAPNLMTIESQKIYDYSKSGLLPEKDHEFSRINERMEKQDLAHKIMILKKYEHIYHQAPELLKRPDASLSPLSYLMSEVLDQYSDQEVQMCLEMLGSEKVENYHETFIKKLYERYSAPSVIENMAIHNQKFFLKFAKHWPHFLKNNAMLAQLINLGKQSSTLAKQQSETLHILTRKNILHPELMEMHLETFMKMKDRERVAEYLQEYLHSAAFLGYLHLSATDTHRLTQLFRRLYKTPDQVPSTSQLLDFLVVLALSKNAYYPDFDPKSVEFVESAINLIEKRFTGQEIFEVALPPNPISGEPEEEKIKLSYYKSIPSHSKVYNKVMLMQSNQQRRRLNFKKAYAELGIAAEIEESAVTVPVEEEEEEEEGFLEEEPLQVPTEVEAAHTKPVSESSLRHGRKSGSADGIELGGPGLEDEEGSLTPPDFILRDDIDAEMHAAVQAQHHKDALNAKRQGKHPQKEKKIYERKASESLYSEELEFHQFRKKKLVDLDKKSKHLLLFSNINQLNFVDINRSADQSSDIAKAWAVLFHFRSKSFDSILYDQFESIAMRNTIGKSKGHELFSKFYLKLIEASYDKGFRMHLTTKCEKTGWPIDISINTSSDTGHASIDSLFPGSQAPRKKLALYFFLQEEVCLNSSEQNEEPLGLQKLMLRHLQSISDFKVEYVTENDFYMNKDTIESYVDYLLQEKLLNAPTFSQQYKASVDANETFNAGSSQTHSQ